MRPSQTAAHQHSIRIAILIHFQGHKIVMESFFNIKTSMSAKEVIVPFFSVQNFKCHKKAMESFFGIKHFKTVMISFFSIKNFKSLKAVVEFFLNVESFKSRKKVTQSFFSGHTSISFHMIYTFPGKIFSVSSH